MPSDPNMNAQRPNHRLRVPTKLNGLRIPTKLNGPTKL
jgi:hypothetical protein